VLNLCKWSLSSLLVLLKKHERSVKKYSYTFCIKKHLVSHVSISAEPPSQRASCKTIFFNTTRATKRNLLTGFWRIYDPRALVFSKMMPLAELSPKQESPLKNSSIKIPFRQPPCSPPVSQRTSASPKYRRSVHLVLAN
jgi:hypothetical protein